MKKFLLYSSFSLLIAFSLFNCDETVSPSNTFMDAPNVQQLTVSPNVVNFVPANGFKDTTFSVNIEATIQNISVETTFGYTIRDKVSQELITSGELTADMQTDVFSANLEFETTTTSFEEYIAEVYAYNNEGSGNFIQVPISIMGFSNNKPEILETSNPEEVQRPNSGQISVSFTAKTTDEDGQNTIDGVFLRLISRVSGEVSGSPFQLFDDGTSQGDQVASDSVFTATFPVSSTNQLQTYDILYYAIDKGGLVSDTTKTTFSIVE